MKVLFLISVLVLLSPTLHAQRSFDHYTCKVAHKHLEKAFYIDVGDRKEIEIGEWTVYAALKKKEKAVEASLTRTVNILGATYKKTAARSYPPTAKVLPVELEHNFGGKTDIFNLICYPRDL